MPVMFGAYWDARCATPSNPPIWEALAVRVTQIASRATCLRRLIWSGRHLLCLEEGLVDTRD